MDSISKYQYLTDLYSAVKSVERPGSFSFGSTLKSFCLPGLQVPGAGPIGLPLSSQQAEALGKVCSTAPFGRKDATIYDESVRKSLQLSPHQFRLGNRDWNSLVQQVADQKVKAGLGFLAEYKITPHLYKLLLYQPGGYFTSHRDSEKEEGMFGTLVFVLPSAHEGGELVIRHAGQQNSYDFSKQDLYGLHYVAFFADCEHEILPVRTGYRLALVYNLIAQGPSQVLLPADNTKAVQQILAAFNVWCRDEEGPQKLVLLLEHKYSNESLAFDKLKGSDITTIDVLLQTAKVCNAIWPAFYFAIGMLEKYDTLQYFGSDPTEEDESRVRSSLRIRNAISYNGAPYRCHETLKVDKEDLVPRNSLEGHEWDDVNDWDTGNEGTEEDRWYRHAAVVIWPHTKAWEIAAINNFDEAVKDACSLSRTLQALPALLEAACLSAGHFSLGEAATVASLVVPRAQAGEMPRALSALCAQCKRLCEGYEGILDSTARAIAHLIVDHGNVELAKAFLVKGYTGPHQGEYKDGRFPPPEWHVPVDVLAPLGTRFGWKTLEQEILVAVRRCVTSNASNCFRVLLDIASPQTGSDPLEGAARDEPNESKEEREAVCSKAVHVVVEELPESYFRRYRALDNLIKDLASGDFYLVLDRFGLESFAPLIDSLIEREARHFSTAVDALVEAVQLRSDVAPPLTSEVSTALHPRDFLLFIEEMCQKVGKKAVSLLLKEGDGPDYGSRGYDYVRSSDTIAGFLKALCCLDFSSEALDQVVSHFLVTPRYHDVDLTLLPAAKSLFKWLGRRARTTPWFVGLVRRCLHALESRCVCPTACDCDCNCSYCKQLQAFCLHRSQTEHCFLNADVAAKAHLRATIHRYKMPIELAFHVHPLPSRFQSPFCVKKGGPYLVSWTDYADKRQRLHEFRNLMGHLI